MLTRYTQAMKQQLTTNVSLTPELRRYVEEKLKAGLYASVSEVIREGLRIMQERDRLNAARLAALRKDIQVGLDELARGEVVDGEKVFARLLKKGHSRRKPKRA
jgi:antitoxin ParD1/3/4